MCGDLTGQLNNVVKITRKREAISRKITECI